MKRAALLSMLVCLLVSPVRAAEPIEGTASWYGPGPGVASQFCTWTLRHAGGCGWARITSLQTGITIVSPVVDWCQCYRGTAQERIVDLQYGPLKALGLDPAQGLYPVSVEWLRASGTLLPNTATR